MPTTFEDENMWAKMTEDEREARKVELLAMAEAFAPTTENVGDQFRHDVASSSGGFECRDTELTSVLRKTTLEIIAVSKGLFMSLQQHTEFVFFLLDGWQKNYEGRLQSVKHQFPDQMHESINSTYGLVRLHYNVSYLDEQSGHDGRPSGAYEASNSLKCELLLLHSEILGTSRVYPR